MKIKLKTESLEFNYFQHCLQLDALKVVYMYMTWNLYMHCVPSTCAPFKDHSPLGLEVHCVGDLYHVDYLIKQFNCILFLEICFTYKTIIVPSVF